jgi:hypothetical protein
MIGAGSAEPEARLRRRIAAIAAPLASNAAGQIHATTCKGRVPIPVFCAGETFEPSARTGGASPGFDAGVGRGS